jgi:hypothetical protein
VRDMSQDWLECESDCAGYELHWVECESDWAVFESDWVGCESNWVGSATYSETALI